jgi:hypothetical protein
MHRQLIKNVLKISRMKFIANNLTVNFEVNRIDIENYAQKANPMTKHKRPQNDLRCFRERQAHNYQILIYQNVLEFISIR